MGPPLQDRRAEAKVLPVHVRLHLRTEFGVTRLRLEDVDVDGDPVARIGDEVGSLV